METKCIALIIVVINIMVCHCHECDCQSNNYGAVRIPVAVVVIFVITLLLLAAVLAFMLYVILKSHHVFRKDKVGHKNMEIVTIEKDDTKSMKQLNLNRSNSFEFNEVPSNQTSIRNQTNDHLGSSKIECGNLQTSTEDTSVDVNQQEPLLSPPSSRIIKGISKDLPIILPEQMSQICKEVLTKTNKYEDIGGSLDNIDMLAKENIPEVEYYNKCASTLVLDMYDVLPPTLRRNKERSNSTEKETESGPASEIYDAPKDSNKLNYVEPYFPPANENRPLSKQAKVDYAVLQQIHVNNEKVDLNDHYEFPKPCDDINKMYINANNNPFKGDSTQRNFTE